MIRKQKSMTDETGNTTVFVTIFLLCMLILATATVTLAKTQWNMSIFSRQTSNSYFLARSGAEKIVDSMNKEVAAALPELMEKAAAAAHSKMLTIEEHKDGVTYKAETTQPYSGEYKGRQNKNLYEVKLKEEIYNYIITKFEDPVSHKAYSMSYKAYSDTKGNEPIEITAKVYHKASTAVVSNVPSDIVGVVNGLIAPNEIATSEKDAFAVEVIAVAKKDTKTSLTKSRVIGTISLDQLTTNDEQLLEEYEWAVDEHGKGIYPEALQAAIISFGDLVIRGDSDATINGDVLVKGTQRKTTEAEYTSSNFPEPDEWGGITVSDAGKLKIQGNALVVSNIQTVNSFGNEGLGATITIDKDAIAHTIAIHDSYYIGHPFNVAPWNNYVKNHQIAIHRNAYIDNDIRIDRYVDKGKIEVTGSVFGISDKDPNGVQEGTETIVDPNKSSGIFSLGLDSTITMGKVFVAGQPFINFGDGNGYHRLHESIGEPFEDVYYLEEYRQKWGHNESYIIDMSDIINKAKIWIKKTNGSKPHAFAPAYVSAKITEHGEGESYDVTSGPAPMTDQTEANKIFYEGLSHSLSEVEKNQLADQSDWDGEIIGTSNKWDSVIADPWNYYNGNNSFNKVFIPETLEDGTSFVYDDMLGYKGLQGYMLAKRGIFYNQFKTTTAITKYEPEKRKFDELIDLGMFTENEWSYNNPVHIITSSKTIDIDQFYQDGKQIPTAIICTDASAVITLKADNALRKEFNGIIITAGKLNIISDMTIKGTIIAGNEYMAGLAPSRESIQRGDWAGVQISALNVKINYDRDMLLNIRCMDKSLQRKLYDCLGITSYQSFTSAGTNEQDQMNAIMGVQDKRKIKLSKASVIFSKQGGLQFVMKSLRKL